MFGFACFVSFLRHHPKHRTTRTPTDCEPERGAHSGYASRSCEAVPSFNRHAHHADCRRGVSLTPSFQLPALHSASRPRPTLRDETVARAFAAFATFRSSR